MLILLPRLILLILSLVNVQNNFDFGNCDKPVLIDKTNKQLNKETNKATKTETRQIFDKFTEYTVPC